MEQLDSFSLHGGTPDSVAGAANSNHSSPNDVGHSIGTMDAGLMMGDLDGGSPSTTNGGGSGGALTPLPASGSGGGDGRTAPQTVPAACLACRSKHLKCDGQTPCSRCLSGNSECVYIASRRGYKGPRRGTAANPHKRHRSASPPASTTSSVLTVTTTASAAVRDSCPMMLGSGHGHGHGHGYGASPGSAMGTTTAPPTPVGTSVASFNPSLIHPSAPHSPFPAATPNLSHMQIFRPFGTAGPGGAVTVSAADAANLLLTPPISGGSAAGPGVVGSAGSGAVIPAQVPVPTANERCVDSFFRHFHAAHPFVLPREYLVDMAKGNSGLDPLLAAIRWIGSLYLDVGPARAVFLEDALRLAYEATTAKDGFLVQTLLLLIIGLDGNCQQEKARQLLADAERTAVHIGLNTRPYATMHGRGISVLEESWRRTWWDLYVVDGMIAGVHRQTNFLLFDVPSDVALPCEEHQFLSGNIPRPMYLEDLEDREFSGEDREFSSFAYRIAAARTLGKFMRVPPIFGPEDENIAKIEAMLTNWRMHLPAAKRDSLDKNLALDEMMFQAHMMTHATSILLHQPHSQLDTSAARSVNSCAPHRVVPSGADFNLHTRHTIQSAGEISRMVTHRVPLLSHSHFFTCVLTLSSVVHLSKWALFFVPHDDDDLRQQIRLNIGALATLSDVWRAARTAAGEVRRVAQEIYHEKRSAQSNPVYWVGFTQEEVINSIAADESIMSEIETLQGVSVDSMPSMLAG